MSNKDYLRTKVGILGGGQLGKMLALAGANWHLPIAILDKSDAFPAMPYSSQTLLGDFNNYQDVYAFGKQVDILTIEIEHVNTAALLQLEAEGLRIHPKPSALQIIQDKGLQKQFYQQHQLPSSDFQLFSSAVQLRQAMQDGIVQLPFVQKTRTAGYDGKGVSIIRQLNDELFDRPCVVEPLVQIEKELAVIVARNEHGELATYPAVEMVFHPTANLVEFLACPARIKPELAQEAAEIAKKVITAFDICGLLAVEFFLTTSGDLLINEVAPRPHNSGHHTIESCFTSQFEQHLRAILNLPLGSTDLKSPAVMLNLLGHLITMATSPT